MKKRINRIILISICFQLIIFLNSCKEMSEHIEDDKAGINGSFEIVKSGLPVNWLLYSPKTVPNSDFDLIVDMNEAHSGKQSLMFLVRECQSTGGWHSPGFGGEWDANPGESYRISLWVKNTGTDYNIKIGSVTGFGGELGHDVTVSGESHHWKKLEYEYKIPEKMEKLRLNVNVLKPGKLWIDDVNIVLEEG